MSQIRKNTDRIEELRDRVEAIESVLTAEQRRKIAARLKHE